MLICWIFIYSAIGQIQEFAFWSNRASEKGIPVGAAAIAASIAIQLLGGFGVLLGFRARIASWALVLFLIPTTLIFHNFWTLQGAARGPQEINFDRNIAIIGGLLFIGQFGAGPYSVDALRASQDPSST